MSNAPKKSFSDFFSPLATETETTITLSAIEVEKVNAKTEVTRNIDPVEAAEQISRDYRRYLKTLISPSNKTIAAEFNREIDESENLVYGPILQLTPPYAPGKSPAQLIDEGVLSPNFSRLDAALPKDRPLYQHQEDALRKIASGRNLIVSTGTGSGKTESFLIPIFDQLLRQQQAGELNPGVRALLLYPMNALANDQEKRLRELLADTPEITFDRYTGDTKQTREEAEKYFKLINGRNATPLPNELISRDEMQENPPHILLTNYAMLEYLLLRPADNAFFDDAYSNNWKFLVLDEAHVYAGAQGTEVGMLMRRLKDRVQRGNPLQCIATSASLEGTKEAIMTFGQDLFGEPFEFVNEDPSRQDLVSAHRRKLPKTFTWSLPDELFDQPLESDGLFQALQERGGDQYEELSKEEHIVKLRELSQQSSTRVEDIGKGLWPNVTDKASMHRTHMLVNLGSGVLSHDGVPALSARYHMFVRAVEGAFLGYTEQGKPIVSLDRQVTLGDTARPMYEMGACIKCGTVHISAHNDSGFLVPPENSSNFDEQQLKWVVLTDDFETADIDEDDLETDADENVKVLELQKLCTACGKLNGKNSLLCSGCSSHHDQFIDVKILEPRNGSQLTCTRCGGREKNLIRRLRTDSNAAPSVLTTSLFQLLPESADQDTSRKIGAGRKLLTFSDSRQAAAYAAPYLQASYTRLLERRILIETLRDEEFTEGASIERWISRASEVAKNNRVLANNLNPRETLEQTGNWVFADLASTVRRSSTEGLGLAKIELTPEALSQLSFRKPLGEMFGDPDAADAFFNLFAQEFRHKGAINCPDYVNLEDERFGPRRGQHFFTKDGGRKSTRRLYSWIPQRGTNNRKDFITKVLNRIGQAGDEGENITTLLHHLWNDYTNSEILKVPGEKAEGYTLNYNSLQVSPGKQHSWYECDTCRNTTPFNVLGLCPHGFCKGKLKEIDTSLPEYANNHYRKLATSLEILPLSAKEHTAQWTPTEAAEVQKEFIEGKINVLSCSTTFELGVDVGDLQSVMMRNVPPRTANYVQRAGRAGRRSGSAAFVLTFAKRSSHDLAVFKNPTQMIDGEMTVPFLHINNARIARRHTYSIALAAFFREQAAQNRFWKKAGEFFLGTDAAPYLRPAVAEQEATEILEEFLSPVPNYITEALRRVFPESLHEDLDIENQGWVKQFLEIFDTTRQEISEDFQTLKKMQGRALGSEQGKKADAFKRTITTLMDQDLLGYLAKKNMLPKYSFPVDTVDLQTNFSEAGNKVSLSRDLQLAITDYAPGAELVAGGKLWKSAGIRHLAGKKVETFYWTTCTECKHTETSRFGFTSEDVCSQCSAPISLGKENKFLIPRFGFVADPNPTEVGTAPPVRSSNRLEFVKQFGVKDDSEEFSNSDGTATAQVLTSSWSRTEMGALETGPNKNGFWYCQTCGFGTPNGAEIPKSHRNPRTKQQCGTYYLEPHSLGHTYQTDIATVAVPSYTNLDFEGWRSGMYAIIEAAAECLEINRDDLNGTMAKHDNRPTMVLFDTVPGGAGITRKVRENFPQVLEAAIRRVETCSCGIDTSCYACLRSFSNQRFHLDLRRDIALDLLHHMAVAMPKSE